MLVRRETQTHGCGDYLCSWKDQALQAYLCKPSPLNRACLPGWHYPISSMPFHERRGGLPQVTDSSTHQLLEHAALDIYSRLLPSLQTLDGEALLMITADSACVWTGSGFAPAGRVVSHLSEDLIPWIYPVPSCLEPFAALLLCLGVSGSSGPKAPPVRSLEWNTVAYRGAMCVCILWPVPNLMA